MCDRFDEVTESLKVATHELFCGYDTLATAVEHEAISGSIEDSVVAMIGFATADGSRGSLTLAAHLKTVARFLPEGMDADVETGCCDVLGELANMLLGRLKNMLLQRGATLLLGTPTTGLVWKLRLAAPSNSFCWLAFDIGDAIVRIRFDADLTDAFQLRPEVTSAESLAEGDLMMF